MVDRYAAEPFSRYCRLRGLSRMQSRAELELFDDLVLMQGLRPGEAGRWLITGPAHISRPPSIAGRCRD